MMPIVVIPDYIYNEITRKLDAAIEAHPDAEPDREFLRSEVVTFFCEHGYVPNFDLGKKAVA